MAATSECHPNHSQKMKYKEMKAQMNDLDRRDCDNYLAICELLRLEAVSNREAFQAGRIPRSLSSHSWFSDTNSDSSNAAESDEAKFAALFVRLEGYLVDAVEPLGVQLFGSAARFDFGDVRANGYRSLLQIVKACCAHLLSDARYVRTSRSSLAFRASSVLQELSAYVACLGELRWCLHYAARLAEMTASSGSLFLPEELMGRPEVQRLLFESEMIDQACFYGRCLGFQYSESLQRPLQGVVTGMAAFSEDFSKEEDSSVLRKLVSVFRNTPKYLFYAEKRGEQIVNMTRNASIDFCKSFWNIAESPILQNIPMLVCPPVEISEAFELPATAFPAPARDPGAEDVLIQPPVAHSGPGPVSVRLISYRQRRGQSWLCDASRDRAPPSPHLLLHCHGGGFVAQSSRSHEVYLRRWAKQLDCPLLSIDYSLAPEAPFPRALEECFFAYCWALRNCRRLGSTGERVVLAGDSAGGNLVAAVCLRAVEFGVRLPDGLFAAYTPVMVRPLPSPARILSVMDPLLPVGVLLRCLLAYAGIEEAALPPLSPPPPFRSGLSSTNSPDEETVLFSADSLRPDAPSPPLSPSSEDSPFEEDEAALAGRGMRKSTTWAHFPVPEATASWTSELTRRHFAQGVEAVASPLFRMQHAPIPRDPYMSPFLADDEVLRQMPPTAVLACHLDPVLDDCVEFAKKLDRLGGRVKLRVMEELPHGFLNFTLLSRDAMDGSDECVRLMEALFAGEEM